MHRLLDDFPEERRNAVLSLLRKIITCFETLEECKGTFPSDASIQVVTWLKQLLEDMFERVPPLSAFSLPLEDEQETQAQEALVPLSTEDRVDDLTTGANCW